MMPDLPTSHRVPVGWLRTHASAPLKWRTLKDILPPEAAAPDNYAAVQAEVLESKQLQLVVKKQRKSGLWGDNVLGLAPNKTAGYKDVGTVAQYRRLVELGMPREERVFRLADRFLFRLLSRDDSPDLLAEYKSAAKTNPDLVAWSRERFREGAAVALAQAGLVEDPRVRGAAHRVASQVSHFLRSEYAEKPITRRSNRNVLHADAHPPTTLAVALFAYMPSLQRERAGFVERLTAFLALPAPKKTYVILLNRKVIQPVYQLLGNPLEADRSGMPKDLPFALHWIEVLVRLGMLHTNETAVRILLRLLADVDANGVWAPKSLRSLPKSKSRLADFMFPLELDGKVMDRRQADVTFRLSLIAKLAGWDLEFV
ncbi:MAG: hypothetical protein OEY20_09550 [Gemmatimonadota bacterium]|nr:hypothetical protein [Gemmatimonadota bacterium]MDH5197483.1 hypothetical protein [Gemmatimonadota bacterium]